MLSAPGEDVPLGRQLPGAEQQDDHQRSAPQGWAKAAHAALPGEAAQGALPQLGELRRGDRGGAVGRAGRRDVELLATRPGAAVRTITRSAR